MPVFKIQKYEEEKPQTQENTPQEENKEEINEIYIRANSTVAELVAKALYNSLGNKAKIEQAKDEEAQNKETVDIVSTEEIVKDPVGCYKSSSYKTICYYSQENFLPKEVTWYLTTQKEQGKKVLLSIESLIEYIKRKVL